MALALPETGWLTPVIARWVTVIGVFAIALCFWFTVRNEGKLKTEQRSKAWKVYDNLVIAFRNLMNTTDKKERGKVHTQIEKERGKLPDKKLDKIIDLFLAAEAECSRYKINPLNETWQHVLSLNNERMRIYIRSKYGDREYGNNKL